MGRVAPLLLLVLALGGCAPPSMRDKGLQPAASTADALDRALAPRRYAIVIGVDAYDDPAFPRLKHAGADAEAMAAVFRKAEGGGFDEVHVLTGPEGTRRDRVLEALRRAKAELRREDALVVYFSGHGTRVADIEGWRRFLLLSDTRSGDLEGTAVDLASVQAWFATVAPQRKSLVVDACFSGDGKSVVRPDQRDLGDRAPLAGSLVPKPVFMGAGESHLFATSAGRPSREDDRLGHGVYTYHLLQAMQWDFKAADLDRDGVLSAFEAHDYARSRTMSHTDGVQIPEAAFRTVGEADVILAGDPGRRRAQEQALLYLYANTAETLATARIVVDGRDRGVFPGTVTVEPGKHHVILQDAEGRSLVEGYATFGSGQALRADDLARLVHGPRRMAGLRVASLVSPAMGEVLGFGAPGLEIFARRRANRGAVKGVYGELALGTGASPYRFVGEERLGRARPTAWSSLALGWQGDVKRLRVRAGWSGTAVLIPPSYASGEGGSDAAAHPWEAGWWFLGTGPVLGLGYVTPLGITLSADARTAGTALDLDGDGTRGLVPFGTLGLGAEVEW